MAIMMIPGSGDHDRSPALELAERFASLRIASLSYDKGGTGSSTNAPTGRTDRGVLLL